MKFMLLDTKFEKHDPRLICFALKLSLTFMKFTLYAPKI